MAMSIDSWSESASAFMGDMRNGLSVRHERRRESRNHSAPYVINRSPRIVRTPSHSSVSSQLSDPRYQQGRPSTPYDGVIDGQNWSLDGQNGSLLDDLDAFNVDAAQYTNLPQLPPQDEENNRLRQEHQRQREESRLQREVNHCRRLLASLPPQEIQVQQEDGRYWREERRLGEGSGYQRLGATAGGPGPLNVDFDWPPDFFDSGSPVPASSNPYTAFSSSASVGNQMLDLQTQSNSYVLVPNGGPESPISVTRSVGYGGWEEVIVRTPDTIASAQLVRSAAMSARSFQESPGTSSRVLEDLKLDGASSPLPDSKGVVWCSDSNVLTSCDVRALPRAS
jgi:hypothetical protein